MKNIKLLFILLLITLLSCRSIDKTIELQQLTTDYPVVLYLNNENDKIIRVKLPIKIKVFNPLISKQWYSSIHYNYEPFNKGTGAPLYVEQDHKLKRIRKTKHKYIYPYQSKEYIIYTRHRVDSSDNTQKQLIPYVQQMLNNKQDTIAIGTIQEFKQKHGDFLQKLTYKDSIHVSTLNADRSKFGEIVIIPVKL